MAYTQYTGKDMTSTFNAVSATGILSIEIAEDSAPLPERIDTTVAGDSAYVFTNDPLGGRGDPVTSVRVTCQTSCEEVTDAGWVTLGGTTHALVVNPDGATAGSSYFTVTNAYLVTIETTIAYDAYSTRTYTYEANEAGTWATT